eukprot:56347-Eustigmatos_ZCMA.PRE.1
MYVCVLVWCGGRQGRKKAEVRADESHQPSTYRTSAYGERCTGEADAWGCPCGYGGIVQMGISDRRGCVCVCV